MKPRRITWTGHVTFLGEKRHACRVLVGRSEGKRKLGRPRGRWEGNIKMDLKELRWDGVGCVHLSQGKKKCLCCEDGNEILSSIKCEEFLKELRNY
jgi:hypothetical protein